MRYGLAMVVLGGVLLQGWCLAQRASELPPPDVVLVTIDTLRSDHVGCFGADPSPTPNLDRLCRESIRYTQAVTASPLTTPSHASIMTGLYPSAHGVSDFGIALPADKLTLAQALKVRGYRSAAFIGAVVLDGKSLAPGLDRGFDFFDYFPAHKPGHWNVVERRGEVVVQHAIDWLTKNLQHPRFVWLHLYDPHDPYEAPAAFAGKMSQPYDDEIAYADAQVGKLLASLKAQGRYTSSLIVLLSDHGEGLGQHKENTHGIFLYDATVRIPLMIKLPGASQGVSDDHQVSSVDVMPTILDIVGAPLPASTDGGSLHANRAPEPRIVISETDYPVRFGWAPLKAARTVQRKFIDAPRPELYDLEHDVAETNDLYAPWRQDVEALRAGLAEHRRRHPASASSVVPASTVEELKALGYLGNVVGATTASDLTLLADPKDKIEVQNLVHEGMMHLDRGDTARSVAAFAKAHTFDPDSGIVLAQLGEAELKAGSFEAAARHLAEAQKKLPQDANTVLRLAEALDGLGDLQKAVTMFQEGLAQSPTAYEPRILLAQVYRKLGNEEFAEDQLQAAVLVSPKKAAARLALARLYLDQRKRLAAREQLLRVLRNEPGNAEAKKLLRAAQ